MPTKRNKAGQQQNYVPQGNGDASGEYADNASGSNKHFANFKKPDEENVNSEATKTESVETPKEDTSKYLGGSQVKSNFSAVMQSNGFSGYGEDAVKDLKEIIANANETCIGIVDHSIMNYRVSFIQDPKGRSSYFNEARNEININVADMNREFEEKGETVFHELGHYLNAKNTIREEHGWRTESLPLVESHILFKGDYKSVAETLQEEIKEFAASKVAPKIRAERRKYLNERLKQYGFKSEEYERNLEKSKDILKTDAEWLDIKDRIKNEWDNGMFESIDAANKKLNEELQNWKKTGSYKDLFASLDYQRPYFRKYQAEWAKLTGIKAVSDVWSSKSDFGFGYGHERGYYKKSWNNPNPENLVADELWANFFGSLTTNNHKALETTQKYFPRTYEKMLKLVDYLNGKRTKYLQEKEQIERFQRGEAI